ncbi:MAG: disulfide bond formation protein B [Polaromonas sp.]|nr:disulfide bond formation protein B [Polaromonas sp.]
MASAFLVILDSAPRRVFAFLSLVCLAMLAFGLYLQHSQGLEPCPMCIVQRYALLSVAILAGSLSASASKRVHFGGSLVLLLAAGFGAFVAARQSWLQWYPPEVATCGRDFYGMIENFPLNRAIPMIFKGSGDCSAIDWTFLGGSIANWAFLVFSATVLLALLMLARRWLRR